MLDDTTTGHALRRLRELSGLSERAAARAIGVRRSVLRSWETQQTLPDDTQIERAVTVYGRDLGGVIADRRPLTHSDRPGVLLVGDEEIVVAEHVPDHADAHPRNAAILRIYVDAVRRQRGARSDEAIELRSDDLRSLATELDLADDQLQDLLADLLDLTPAGAQFATRALLVGALLAILATGTVQSTWLAPTASASPASTVPAVITEQHVSAPLPFWAGDLGPTERGPTFSTEEADTRAVSPSTPSAPPAEVTPDEVPYAIFGLEPVTDASRAAAPSTAEPSTFELSAGAEPDTAPQPTGATDESGLFSVTPRGSLTGTSAMTDRSSGTTPAGPAALPPGNPALPAGD